MVEATLSRIFLIEDDPTMVNLLEILLKMEKFITAKIEKEETGLILAQLIAFKPDLILMDVHLNKLNGLDLLTEIRNHPELSNSKIIITSGSDIRDFCLSSGANGFIMKPYMPDELLKVIHSHLQ
jgi:DNA-binding response OmpR family regulator